MPSTDGYCPRLTGGGLTGSRKPSKDPFEGLVKPRACHLLKLWHLLLVAAAFKLAAIFTVVRVVQHAQEFGNQGVAICLGVSSSHALMRTRCHDSHVYPILVMLSLTLRTLVGSANVS